MTRIKYISVKILGKIILRICAVNPSFKVSFWSSGFEVTEERKLLNGGNLH
jgi:hypothetical protein